MIVLNGTAKAQAIKVKIDNNSGCIKLKSFCTAKETLYKIRKNCTNERKYLKLYIFDEIVSHNSKKN